MPRPASPGAAFASGLLAGLAAAVLAAALAIGLSWLFARWRWWPFGGPDIGALVAGPAAAWTTSQRRGCAVGVRVHASVLALLLGFLGYWLFEYVMLLGLLGPAGTVFDPGDAAQDIAALLTGTMLRAALATSLLNSILGALLGLMAARRPDAWSGGA